jgi:nucleoside-diphosphate-sugar epimerase
VRVLVTRGAGFIGSHVTDSLLAEGHEVAVADDLSRGRRENVPGGAAFYGADIRSGCKEVFEEFGADRSRPGALAHSSR